MTELPFQGGAAFPGDVPGNLPGNRPGTGDRPGTTVTVNGTPYEAPMGSTVADLVSIWCPSPRGVAVAIGSEVVPRSTWAETVIDPGAVVEIVTAAAGG